MEEADFRDIVATQLVPLLGAMLSDEVAQATPHEKSVSYATPCRLKLRPSSASTFKVFVDRSQPFSPVERRLAEHFIDELSSVSGFTDSGYMSDVLSALPRRLVIRHLHQPMAFARVLEHMETWSSQTYEGQRITSAVGISSEKGTIPLGIKAFFRQPFAPVIGDGVETLLVCGTNGKLRDLIPLDDCAASPKAPASFARVAGWTRNGAVAAVLNRHGEILVFADGELAFSKRRGRWLHYVHDSVIQRMWPPMKTVLRRSLYESCLDVSFARTGACIGVIAGGRGKDMAGGCGSI